MGVMGNNPDQAGRYNGFNTTGVDVIGEFDFTRRRPGTPVAPVTLNLTGNNLVFQAGTGLGNGLGGCSIPAATAICPTPTTDWRTAVRWSSRPASRAPGKSGSTYDSITYTGNVIDSLYTVNGTPWRR